MKKVLFGATAIALALIAGSTFAADLPTRKEPAYIPPPPPPMWTGFYVGLNAGGAWTDNNGSTLASGPLGGDPGWLPAWLGAVSAAGASAGAQTTNAGAFIGGGQAGYNLQFQQNFVVGIEADIQGVAGGNGSMSSANIASLGPAPIPGYYSAGETIGTAISTQKQLDYFGTVRGRLGYLAIAQLADLRHGRSRLWRSLLERVSLSGEQRLLLSPPRSLPCSRDRHRRELFQHSGRLDRRRRHRMDVPAELERQVRVSVLRSRQLDVHAAASRFDWRIGPAGRRGRGRKPGLLAIRRQYRPAGRELSLQLGRAGSCRRQILIVRGSYRLSSRNRSKWSPAPVAGFSIFRITAAIPAALCPWAGRCSCAESLRVASPRHSA